MKEKTKEKLLLCLQEVSWINELLAEKQTDSITARMLCIYASIRLDDVYHCMPDYPDHHLQRHRSPIHHPRLSKTAVREVLTLSVKSIRMIYGTRNNDTM